MVADVRVPLCDKVMCIALLKHLAQLIHELSSRAAASHQLLLVRLAILLDPRPPLLPGGICGVVVLDWAVGHCQVPSTTLARSTGLQHPRGHRRIRQRHPAALPSVKRHLLGGLWPRLDAQLVKRLLSARRMHKCAQRGERLRRVLPPGAARHA